MRLRNRLGICGNPLWAATDRLSLTGWPTIIDGGHSTKDMSCKAVTGRGKTFGKRVDRVSIFGFLRKRINIIERNSYASY